MSDDRIESQEERLLILRDKAAREGFVIGDDVLDYIAAKYALPTTLKGALINVQAFASRRGVPVTLSLARLALDGIRETPVAAPAAEEIGPLDVDEPVVVEVEVVTDEAASPWEFEVELDPHGAVESDAEPEAQVIAWDEPVVIEPLVEPEHSEPGDAGPEPIITETLFAPPPPVAVPVVSPPAAPAGSRRRPKPPLRPNPLPHASRPPCGSRRCAASRRSRSSSGRGTCSSSPASSTP